jgi:putative transposase
VGRHGLSWPEGLAPEGPGLEIIHPAALVGGVWARVGAEPPTRPSGFQVLARRWVVERTIGWLTTNRRLAKDYERFVETGEMLLYLAMSRILLRRLTRKHER